MTKSDTEREISQAIIQFEKEYMGRGPLQAKVFIIEDMVLVRLKNVLTPAELKLSDSENSDRGRHLIKEVRQELIEEARPLLDKVIKDITGINVTSLHTDISSKTGERIIVFTLEEEPKFAEWGEYESPSISSITGIGIFYPIGLGNCLYRPYITSDRYR